MRVKKIYQNDTLTAVAATPSGTGNFNWVFIGNNFDYSLTSGADTFLRAPVSGEINKSAIQIEQKGIFTLNKEKMRLQVISILNIAIITKQSETRLLRYSKSVTGIVLKLKNTQACVMSR